MSEASETIERLNRSLSGRYRVERELGEGGMATVYLAADLKHNRKIAIKVLRPQLAALIGADRFLAEIETTAQLQHPHILPLYDSGDADGLLWYVMPYVEGESLAGRLERERQLPVEEAVRIGGEVADALDYAHRQGVIHRDVKPANVLLHEGRALVADFGIALAVREAGGARLTETGLSLGTPWYMSPEQATADREVDARSDVYSLGAMTYEMLAGRPPHTGATLQSVIASVLTREPPPVDEERTSVPPHRALARLPADRFQSAAELGDALRDPPAHVRKTRPAALAEGERGRTLERLAWAAGAVALAIGTFTLTARGPTADSTNLRFRFQISIPYLNYEVSGRRVDISRDGRTLVYLARGGPRDFLRMYTRDLSGLEASSVSDATEGGLNPEFSPDGRFIFFNAPSYGAGVVDAVRGTVTTTWTIEGGVYGGGHWADDGSIYTATLDGVVRLPTDGGLPEQVVGRTRSDFLPTSVRALPDGRGFLFSAASFSSSVSDVWVHDAGSRESRVLVSRAAHPTYLPMGVVVYQTPEGRLDGVRIDLESLEVVGEPRPLLRDIEWGLDDGRAYAVSDNGVLVYEQVPPDGVELVWMDTGGRQTPVAEGLSREIVDIAISPEGSRFAYQGLDGGAADIFVYDLEQRTRTRLTTGGGENWRPTWLPGGDRIAFVSDREGAVRGIYTRPVDGSGPAEPLIRRDRFVQQLTWRGDGTYVFREGFSDTLTQRDLFSASLEDTTARPFVVTEFDELAPAFSPDGNWVAYLSTEGGQDEIYARPFTGPGGRVAISTDGGSEPAWAPDGSAIYYRSAHDSLVAAELSFQDRGLRVTGRTNLFSMERLRGDRNDRPWDVHPDGERFVFIREPENVALVIATDWFGEVREILGMGAES